jgi:hypothetical protein
MSAAPPSLTLTALRELPEVLPGSDLAALLAQALTRAGFKVDRSFDVGPRELARKNGFIELWI